MKPIAKRLAAWAGWIMLAGAWGCAQGSPAEPVTQIDPPAIVVEALCGNGKMDMGEQCDCTNPMASGQCKVDGATCAMLKGSGSTGMVLCNAKPLCTFNLDQCSGGPGGATGGTGAAMSGVMGAGGTGR